MQIDVDEVTRQQFAYQARRMHEALHGNPRRVDQKEADLIQKRVDDILDRRPRVHSVAPDGEVIYDNQSPWVQAQVALNDTGQAERVLTPSEQSMLARWSHVLGSLPETEEPK